MSRSSTSDGYICPVFGSSGKCGEQDALRIMEQFKDFYEEKLNEVDVQGGGDCMEMKIKIQRRWIEDLTEQTQMMARIVKELEDEATNRVRMLEDKLRQTSKSAYEVMKRYQTYSISHNLDEPFQKVFYLENDLKNLIEFVRRIRDDKKWSIEGLQFYEVTCRDLFGQDNCDCDDKGKRPNSISNGLTQVKKKATQLPDDAENCPENSQPYDQLDVALKNKTREYEELRQSMLDMRSALTEEVACKHDMISALKKDIQQLEERCVQGTKQTAFKDDIIKELRKENKQLKQQISYNTIRTKSKNHGHKSVFTTVRHCQNTEIPKYSTVIFINENQKDNREMAKQNKSDQTKKKNETKIELSQSENDLLMASYLKEIPVKEKSKFTVTNFNGILEKADGQGRYNRAKNKNLES